MSNSFEENPKVTVSGTLENSDNNKSSSKEEEILNELDNVNFSLVNSDTQCGWGFGNWTALQRYANQNTFVIVYGLTGCILSMTLAYFNGTITTLEKRFHLSSRNIGITQCGNDFTQMLTSLLFIHYVSKRHRPRWMSFGILTTCFSCVLATLPHWLYGPGDDALKLTSEFGAATDENITKAAFLAEDSRNLCHLNATEDHCKTIPGTGDSGHAMLILFISPLISGFGWSLYYTLGYAYMDDNVASAKAPTIYSFTLFFNFLGPSLGYTLAAFCLRHYVSPVLTPVIDNKDPRWIGAWWMGWLIFGSLLFVSSFFLGMFPKELPSARRRKLPKIGFQIEPLLKIDQKKPEIDPIDDKETKTSKSSSRELFEIFMRVIKNKIFMCNHIASICYCFGYMPYWIFTPKYLEIVFHQSTAESNVYTGTVALVFTAIGVLTSGAIISRKKPSARILAAWNAMTGILTVVGFFSYSFIGCYENENSIFLEQPSLTIGESSFGCADTCHCEFIPYAPVCGDNNLTYISACHAGCKDIRYTENGNKIFYNCDCVRPFTFDNATLTRHFIKQFNITDDSLDQLGGSATPGICPANCFKNFIVFLVLLCTLKFIGSTTRASYFLIQLRSVSVEDKTVALGLGMVMVSLFSFIPSPIFFGWLLDRMCLVWGKTCTATSNCWLYDAKRLRYTLNYTASAFISIGVLCDCVNCFLVKDLKIFDDDEKKSHEEKSASNMELAKLSAHP